MRQFQRSDINGVIGSTFLTADGAKLLIERELGDELLHVIALPSGATHRVEDPETGELTMPDRGWLERSLAEGMRRIGDVAGPVAPAREIARLYDREEIIARDPYAVARLRLMLGLIEQAISPSDPNLGKAIDRIWDDRMVAEHGKRPPTKTVRSWFGRCRTTTVTLEDMMSMSGRVPRDTRLDPAVEEVIQQERPRYWANRGIKIADVMASVTTRIDKENIRRTAAGEPLLDLPGKETVRRRVAEMECRDTYAEKYGEDAARRKFDGSGRGISASRILQVVIMDDTVVDLVTCLDADRGMIAGRPYLCVLMDVHSRTILGLVVSFQPPTLQTAAQCLRRANAPKLDIRPDRRARYPALATLNGKPAKIITDNGSNYVAPAFGEMLLDLGIAHELAPVKAPRHKAMIERFFRSLNTFLIDKLPGATLDPSVLRKLGIDPAAEAIVTITELKALLAEFLYVYHISHHSGIDAAPLDMWERSARVHGRDMILDQRRLDIVTGVTIPNKRITANGGVRMLDMQWKGAGLPVVIDRLAAREPHSQRLDATAAVTTRIKYNPEDMLHVHAFVGDDWIRLDNTQPEYAAGLTLWQHEQIRQWAKRQSMAFNTAAERLAARDELNRTIRDTFRDMDARERRAMARMMGADAVGDTAFTVVHAEAEPRHDGMGPIIENRIPADDRADLHRVQSRPGPIARADDGAEVAPTDDDDHSAAFGLEAPILPPSSVDEDEAGEEDYR